ncbi:MAG: alpha/beta hydrolase-fold protein [candidate division WOR-3 bacterium]|nr:alpha/beta hydrolase-fold protein [candidate division WOR-3 bacterium]
MKLLAAVALATLATIVWAQPAVNELDPRAGDFLVFPVDSVSRDANDAYQAAKYAEAARLYLTALQHDVTNSGDIYNLACCYGLLKQDTLAALYLGRAFRAGFDDVEHVKQDPDFDSVRTRPVFAAVVDSLSALADSTRARAGTQVEFEATCLIPGYIRLPANYDSTRAYPLVIGLHGYGATPKSFSKLYERAGSPEIIFVCLQGPYQFGAGRDLGFSWTTWDKNDSTTAPRAAKLSGDFIAETARRLTARFKTGGTWLLGFSQGCAAAYYTGIRYPSLFQGVICFGNGFDTLRFTAADYAAAKGLRVFSSHGREDRVVEYAYGAASRDFLKRRGFKVTVADSKGGHTVPEEPLRQAVKWMGAK